MCGISRRHRPCIPPPPELIRPLMCGILCRRAKFPPTCRLGFCDTACGAFGGVSTLEGDRGSTTAREFGFQCLDRRRCSVVAGVGPPLYRLRAETTPLSRRQSIHSAKPRSGCFYLVWTLKRVTLFSPANSRALRGPDRRLPRRQRGHSIPRRPAYEAHVQSSSRETLKTLADLRKTVIDETQKVAQRTQDLTAALWRDLAVTATPFVVTILGDAGKSASRTFAAGLYFGSAVFIFISFILQWRINEAYFESQTTSRAAWMKALYSQISTRERDEIADTPIVGVMKSYYETRRILLVIYGVLVVLLIGFGIFTLRRTFVASLPAMASISKPIEPPKPTVPWKTVAPPVCVPSTNVHCPKGGT